VLHGPRARGRMEPKQSDSNIFISTGTEYYHPEDTEQEIRAGCSCFTAKKSAKRSTSSENPRIPKTSSQGSTRSFYNDPSLHLNKHLEPVVPIRRGAPQTLTRVTSVSHQNSSNSSTGSGSGRKDSTGSGSGSGPSAHSSTICPAPADQGINLPAIPRS